jgi:DNA modification methylase
MSYFQIPIDAIKHKVYEKHIKAYNEKDVLFKYKKATNIKEITNDFGETLTRVDGEIPLDLKVSKGQRFLFISYDQTRYTHGIHKYPAKFFPELPRWLIQKYSEKSDIILDPFTGSATSNIEAILNRRHSVGIDVDPFSRFLAKVKTTKLEESVLKSNIEDVLNEIIKYKPQYVSKSDIPIFPYRDNWFIPEILSELAFIKKIISNQSINNNIIDFYKVCLSSIIRAVSNADNNCTRTVVRKKLNKNVFPSLALTKFAEVLLINSLRIIEFSKIYPKNIITEIPDDSEARIIKYPDNYFSFALTSPPYVNAVDYPRTHQLEMYWLDFFNGSLTPLKRKHIGTESVLSADYKFLHKINIEEADIKISKIYDKDKRRAFIAYKYLQDMEENLKEVFRTLKPGGKYAVVVGNNSIRGEVFESWLYLMKISERVGFKINNYFGSEIINHFIKVPREERINTDWVIILEK